MPGPETACFTLYFQFCFERASEPTSFFGFAEYIAALALLLVVLTVADFRYRYRMQLTRFHTSKIAFYVSLTVAVLILLADLWFHNNWWIPPWLNNAYNLRAGLAAIFLTLVFYMLFVAYVRPPTFGRANARSYFYAMQYHIGGGDPNRLAIVADEIRRSAKSIVSLASPPLNANDHSSNRRPTSGDFAYHCLLLLGNRAICKAMVEKSPWTVAEFFYEAADCTRGHLPLTQFARNIGAELVHYPDSALHHEDEMYSSGLLGYTKPITTAVYGNFALVERLAADGGSPLDIDMSTRDRLNASQLEAYSRGALLFSAAYFASPSRSQHSYAFTRMLGVFESSVMDLSRLDGVENDFWDSDQYQRLRITVRFIEKLVALMDENDWPRGVRLRPTSEAFSSVHDQIAALIFEIIFATSLVSEPDWTCWSVQHNAVWSQFFRPHDSAAWKHLSFKVRRHLYDEIIRMNDFPNFKSARILGFCLNVMGLSEARSTGRDHDKDALRLAVLVWTKRHYLGLVESHPRVAESCLHGSISYDAAKKRLVKTYSGDQRKEPTRRYLNLENQAPNGAGHIILQPAQ